MFSSKQISIATIINEIYNKPIVINGFRRVVKWNNKYTFLREKYTKSVKKLDGKLAFPVFFFSNDHFEKIARKNINMFYKQMLIKMSTILYIVHFYYNSVLTKEKKTHLKIAYMYVRSAFLYIKLTCTF